MRSTCIGDLALNLSYRNIYFYFYDTKVLLINKITGDTIFINGCFLGYDIFLASLLFIDFLF